MWVFYLCTLIPILIGLVLWWRDNEITLVEWLGASAACFVVAGIMHIIAFMGMTADTETWSGQITKVSHYPRWVEEYQESHSETVDDGNGKSHTRIWTTTEHDTHHEHWGASRSFGTYEDEEEVDEVTFGQMAHKFGNRIVDDGKQSCSHIMGSFDGGDNGIYSAYDNTGYVYPVTITKTFENRIKAAPTVFSFSKVPTNINVYAWPENPDWLHSDRLLGTASILVDHYKWDCMNASLGSRKKVNLIMVGFGDVSDDMGHYQQAKWIGGKKNDLVICFGGATKTSPPKWVYVFGWTESELVKQDLMTIVLTHPVNDNVIPLISEEVAKNYKIKDWHKFDYITIDPPTWAYWVYFIMMAVTQTGLYIYFQTNQFGKDGSYSSGWRRSCRSSWNS